MRITSSSCLDGWVDFSTTNTTVSLEYSGFFCGIHNFNLYRPILFYNCGTREQLRLNGIIMYFPNVMQLKLQYQRVGQILYQLAAHQLWTRICAADKKQTFLNVQFWPMYNLPSNAEQSSG